MKMNLKISETYSNNVVNSNINHIPVNNFSSYKQLQTHSLINGIPLFIIIIVAIVTFTLDYVMIGATFVFIGCLYGLVFGIITYLYSNSRLYIQHNGIFVKRGKNEVFIPWLVIKEVKFENTIGNGIETVMPPIRLRIFYSDSSGDNEYIVFLYKYRFKTPRFLYYKLLSLIGTIPEARHLLPEQLLEKTS